MFKLDTSHKQIGRENGKTSVRPVGFKLNFRHQNIINASTLSSSSGQMCKLMLDQFKNKNRATQFNSSNAC